MADEQKPDQAAGAAPESPTQTAPPDALEKTNEELGTAAASETATNADGTAAADGKPAKKPSAFKAFLKRFNLYLLLFLLVVVIGAAVAVVGYLNGKKQPEAPNLNNQTLDADTLKQLVNSDATVGDTGQTLTVQGNAIFSGQVLVRSNLNVAGTIQLGGEFTVPSLTVSSTANLLDTQIDTLQVAKTSTLQGAVTLQNDLNVAGDASFNGSVTIGQLTVSKLIMSGNGQLEIPNHIAFTGASPSRSSTAAVIGSGGTTSINGSDVAGTININTGSGPVAGCFVAITFIRPFASTPRVIVSPVGSAAGQLQYYVDRSTTGFSLCTNNAAAANQTFAFDYFVTGL